MPKNALLDAYIEAEKAKIQVEPYHDKVTSGAFRLRTQGYWSGMGMGLTWGTLVGAIVSAALPTFGIELSVATALKTVAMFSGIGIVTGGTAGQIIGSAAGASAAGNQEKERREKAEALEKEIRLNPPAPAKMQEAVQQHEHLQKELIASGEAPFDSIEELHSQTGNGFETFKRLFKPKVVAAAGALGMVIGAVLAFGAQMTVPGLLLGKDAGMLATTLLGTLIGGVAGTSFGISFPVIFTSGTKLAGSILSGKIFEEKQAPAPAVSPSLYVEQASPLPAKTVCQPCKEAPAPLITLLDYQGQNVQKNISFS